MLTATASGGVTVTPFNPATGVLLLSGTASLAAYQTVLGSVQYNNTSGGPGVASETVNVVANDGTSNSNTAISTISIVSPVVELDAPKRELHDQLDEFRRGGDHGVDASPARPGVGFPAGHRRVGRESVGHEYYQRHDW